MAPSCGKEAGFDYLKNLAMAYYLVPGLEKISAGSRQEQGGRLKGEKGYFSGLMVKTMGQQGVGKDCGGAQGEQEKSKEEVRHERKE
jgi:hypothetical protein